MIRSRNAGTYFCGLDYLKSSAIPIYEVSMWEMWLANSYAHALERKWLANSASHVLGQNMEDIRRAHEVAAERLAAAIEHK